MVGLGGKQSECRGEQVPRPQPLAAGGLDHFPDRSEGEDPREGALSSNRALLALLAAVCLAEVSACKQQQDLYCIAIRYARADAGAENLGSPFDALPAGSEINPHDVVSKPHILVTERGKTTLSHVEHPF